MQRLTDWVINWTGMEETMTDLKIHRWLTDLLHNRVRSFMNRNDRKDNISKSVVMRGSPSL